MSMVCVMQTILIEPLMIPFCFAYNEKWLANVGPLLYNKNIISYNVFNLKSFVAEFACVADISTKYTKSVVINLR